MRRLSRLLKMLVCVGLLASFTGCASTQKSETAGQYVDDSVITSKVKAALFDDMALKTFQINVKTYRGIVQLSGFVDSPSSVQKAGDIARGVKGVQEVRNDLIVK